MLQRQLRDALPPFADLQRKKHSAARRLAVLKKRPPINVRQVECLNNTVMEEY